MKRQRPRLDRVEVLAVAALTFVVIVTAVNVVENRWFPLHYAILKVKGRVDPRCPLALAHASKARRDEREEVRRQHRLHVRLVKRDGPITKWQTPSGPVWTATRDVDSQGTAGLFHASESIRWARVDGKSDPNVRPGDVVFDCGAHIGESTRAALSFGARLVVAVEPSPDNVAALKNNLAKEIIAGRVIVIEKGVHDHVGTLTFARHFAGSRSGSFENDEQGEPLPVTTIDELVRELGLPDVNFIKMDIEGAEVPALQGAKDTIRRFAPRIAVGTYHQPTDLREVESTVLAIRPTYTVACSRCLDMWYERLFPNLLYFE